jgi:hypothetical protein
MSSGKIRMIHKDYADLRYGLERQQIQESNCGGKPRSKLQGIHLKINFIC